jgi:hypothetical protein
LKVVAFASRSRRLVLLPFAGLLVAVLLLLSHAAEGTGVGGSVTGQTSLIDNLAGYDDTVVMTAIQDLDAMAVTCHGGRASIVWYVGNLEPENEMTGIHIGVYFDGELVGSLLKGGTSGVYEDGPAEIRAVVDCSAGWHSFTARIYSISGTWGVPYANSGDLVMRGFVMTEVWP